MRLYFIFLNLLINEEMIKIYEENVSRLGIQIDTDKEFILKKFGGFIDVGNVFYEVFIIYFEFEIGADCNIYFMDFIIVVGKD